MRQDGRHVSQNVEALLVEVALLFQLVRGDRVPEDDLGATAEAPGPGSDLIYAEAADPSLEPRDLGDRDVEEPRDVFLPQLPGSSQTPETTCHM